MSDTSPAPPPRRVDRQHLAAARLWAAHRFPYLASALFASPVVSVPGLGTVAVDEHWRLYADPALVEELDVEELGTVLLHHVGHLLRDHAGRARSLGLGPEMAEFDGHRTLFRQWTLAADLEINDDLAAALLTLAEGALQPHELQLEPGRLAEEYLHQIRPADEECAECGSGAHAHVRDWEIIDDAAALSPNAAHLLRCQVAAEILRHGAGGIGSVPGGWERWAHQLIDPKVDWRTVLANELRRGVNSASGAVDYSYSRPSRRSRSVRRVVLPSMVKPVPDVAVVCDTSGSMSEDDLGTALSEVEGILRSIGVRRDRLRILACDAAAHTAQRVSSARQVRLNGGGGTDMGVGIAHAQALRPTPNVIVVLTDGLTPWPAEAPPVPVVIGLIGPGAPEPPTWARWVRIEDVE